MRKHRFNANILDTFYEFPEATQPRAGVCRKWERIVQFGRCFATIEVPVIVNTFSYWCMRFICFTKLGTTGYI